MDSRGSKHVRRLLFIAVALSILSAPLMAQLSVTVADMEMLLLSGVPSKTVLKRCEQRGWPASISKATYHRLVKAGARDGLKSELLLLTGSGRDLPRLARGYTSHSCDLPTNQKMAFIAPRAWKQTHSSNYYRWSFSQQHTENLLDSSSTFLWVFPGKWRLSRLDSLKAALPSIIGRSLEGRGITTTSLNAPLSFRLKDKLNGRTGTMVIHVVIHETTGHAILTGAIGAGLTNDTGMLTRQAADLGNAVRITPST